MRMKIGTDLTKEDYKYLIMEAKCNIISQRSHKPCKLYILNHEVVSEIICEGVRISDGGIDINGNYTPPIMEFAFIFKFLYNDYDFVKAILKESDVEIDGRHYYLGDYLFQNEVFKIKYVSYDLFKEEIWKK